MKFKLRPDMTCIPVYCDVNTRRITQPLNKCNYEQQVRVCCKIYFDTYIQFRLKISPISIHIHLGKAVIT